MTPIMGTVTTVTAEEQLRADGYGYAPAIHMVNSQQYYRLGCLALMRKRRLRLTGAEISKSQEWERESK